MKVRAGTSGYQYAEWKGVFYPEGCRPADMLTYYASRLPTVEINNTFYRLPKSHVLEKWAGEVPEDFRFVTKASRRITHMSRLKESADDTTTYMFETLESLGDRLGMVLLQLPPFLKADLPRLERFVATLPDGPRVAIEFRHESWFEPSIAACLTAARVAQCVADTDDGAAAFTPTTDVGYLRLRRPGYTDAELDDWAARIRDTDWREAYVFFKHEDDGAGPTLAARFLERMSD